MTPPADGAMAPLLTSADVARLLGVTAATVKRWADDGRLACARTAGRHRRFAAEAVERFRRERCGEGEARWVDRLLAEPDVVALHADLLAERARRGAWWPVATWLGGELHALGERWADGRIGIVEEHLASERLARALARCAEALPPRAGAPRALLAAAEGDEHLLGLSLVDLCLREVGWSTAWAGRRTPAAELERLAGTRTFAAIVLSASVVSTAEALAAEASRLAGPCAAHRVHLLLGGRGPWPTGAGRVERTFEGLRAFVDDVERGREK